MKKIKKQFDWEIGHNNGSWHNECVVVTNKHLKKIKIYNEITHEEKVGWTTNLGIFLSNYFKKAATSDSKDFHKKRVSRLSSPIDTKIKLKEEITPKQEHFEEVTLKMVLDILKAPYLKTLAPIDFGKLIQSPAEDYITIFVNEKTEKIQIIDPNKISGPVKERYYKGNNGPGFDRLLKFMLSNEILRLQIKFRQVDGKTPYSRATHFSNTRRHSNKNKGKGDETGTISYGEDEMDYVLVILSHTKTNPERDYRKWAFSLIPVNELKDANRNGFLVNSIPSKVLESNKCDDIYMLTKKLENLNE